MKTTALVAVGGLVGSVLRFWIGGAVQQISQSRFPFGTLFVNIAGSFVLGLVMYLVLERQVLSNDARSLLAIGFCGGFTTMSTFSYETVLLIRQGDPALSAIYVAVTLVSCTSAVWLATWLAGRA